MVSVKPNGSINGKTAKQVYSFTHFDTWAYGTNFFTISMFKSGHNDPASPVQQRSRAIVTGERFCRLLRRRDRNLRPVPLDLRLQRNLRHKAFTMGPLRNVSFEVGMDANTENNFLAPAKRDVVGRSAVRI